MQDDTKRARVDDLKADIARKSSCSKQTVLSLQELLQNEGEGTAQKENLRSKGQPPQRKRGGLVTVPSAVDKCKDTATGLTPREKYILATEVANVTLKNLAESLRSINGALGVHTTSTTKCFATDDTPKPARRRPASRARSPSNTKGPLTERSVSQLVNSSQKQAPQRSLSHSSIVASSSDAHLVATAECARLAFVYLGTLEAKKLLGKDSQDLQVESGMLVLIGKLVALDLDQLAVKEIRTLKERLENHLGHDISQKAGNKEPARKDLKRCSPAEKENLASILHFGTIKPQSPALPLVANLQIHVLRLMAKSKHPPTIETAWDHLQLSNPSSPAAIILGSASTPGNEVKIARQLDSLAHLILALCPSVSTSNDGRSSQPTPDTVLRLQQLAFKIRKSWWEMAKHKGDEEVEIVEPFAKCLSAFARRSRLLPAVKYQLASELLEGLAIDMSRACQNLLLGKQLGSLAQAAGKPSEALKWLQESSGFMAPLTSRAKQAAQLLRVANISLDALLKGDLTTGPNRSITAALVALRGSLDGSSTDLDTLFVETNSFRRTATKVLVAKSSTLDDLEPLRYSLISIVEASVHFTARLVDTNFGNGNSNETNASRRRNETMLMIWKNVKSMSDSVIACCKQMRPLDVDWEKTDVLIHECAHILLRMEEEAGSNSDNGPYDRGLLLSLMVKLSNMYWTVSVQLRRAGCDSKTSNAAMQRSVALLQSTSQETQEAGNLVTKLEQLGDALESQNDGESSQQAYEQCIHAYMESDMSQILSTSASTESLSSMFSESGPLRTCARVLKALHRSVMKFGPSTSTRLGFFDDDRLEIGTRGILLEYQLGLYVRTLSKNRQWDDDLNVSMATLIERLVKLYGPTIFPMRRLRFHIALLSLRQTHRKLLPLDLLSHVTSDLDAIPEAGTQDAALTRFDAHLRALLGLRLALQQPSPSTPALQRCFSTWEALVDSSSSWNGLADRIENTEEWIQDLQACAEFLNAKGEEYLTLPVLRLLVRLGELEQNSDASDLVTNMCALGLQLLRLGYTGKAGMFLAKAEVLLGNQRTTVEAKLRWHIAYAEYLARLGTTQKSFSVMSTASSLAQSDSSFVKLAEPSTPLSGRIRLYRILADAAYVNSLLTSATGNYKDSARFAKQCVTLNRRIWASIESKANTTNDSALQEAGSLVARSNKAGFSESLNVLRDDKGYPLVVSVTHDALSGIDFWSLIPALYRGLMQQSQVLSQQGLLHEALHVADQAGKVAAATGSPTFVLDNASWRADCWAQSGRPEKARTILDSLQQDVNRKCLSVAGFHSAMARIHHWSGHYEEETSSYHILDQLLADLTSPVFINSLERFSPDIDALTEHIKTMTVAPHDGPSTSGRITTRSRKPALKTQLRDNTQPKPSTRSKARAGIDTKVKSIAKIGIEPSTAIGASSISEQCFILLAYRAEIVYRNVIANLSQDKLTVALSEIQRTETFHSGANQDPSHDWVKFKTKLAQTFKQITQNVAVNTLPESTIAFPALGLEERRSAEDSTSKPITKSLSTTKVGRPKQRTKEDFIDLLRTARDHLAEAHAAYATKRPVSMFRQVSSALCNVTVLLSAVCPEESRSSLSPLYAAYLSELPNINVLQLAQDYVEVEKELFSRDEYLKWPAIEVAPIKITSLADFSQDYIDAIPRTWTVVALALNENCDELYITRVQNGSSPFVLRLPLARHASRDLDEGEFTFKDGRRDFEEIIELSDFSTRSAKDMTSKEARQQWWTEREALDARLHELLLNMENIWLGGFKGVFSQHDRQPKLLARFRKALDDILNRHLPSRRKKTQQKKSVLENQVLELFIGLGNPEIEELDLDEALMDLIYFVVDILHFNGERNAYDEIDFDAMVVETQEALQAYHSASETEPQTCRHTVLILDKNLHGFPWESLPCLEQTPISRLPSLAALRERLLTMRPSKDQQNRRPGHYIRAESGGASILNPSGDLSHTLKMVKPRLDELHGPWTHVANRTPSEEEFKTALGKKDLVLYFGHGSGAQYVRTKTVRRLHPGQQGEQNARLGCATTFLFGCSSVHLTENGVFESSGMLASYLTAGAPAVVGMLWDVTDKDCDRFAVKVGELWGLWAELDSKTSDEPPKRVARKRNSGGRVAQLVRDKEGPPAITNVRKGGKQHGLPDELSVHHRAQGPMGLDYCVMEARKACVLRYLNGAAAVVYGIPVYYE